MVISVWPSLFGMRILKTTQIMFLSPTSLSKFCNPMNRSTSPYFFKTRTTVQWTHFSGTIFSDATWRILKVMICSLDLRLLLITFIQNILIHPSLYHGVNLPFGYMDRHLTSPDRHLQQNNLIFILHFSHLQLFLQIEIKA